MRSQRIKRVVYVVLPIVTALCLSLFFPTHGSLTVSAHALYPQKPQSGCCAVVYTHVATSSNTTGNWTELDNKDTNSNPNAFVIATPNLSGGTGGVVDNHPIGVWYDAMAGRWGIFNQDRVAMPVGAAFNIYAIQAFLQGGNQAGAILDVASSSNSKGNWTYIDSPVTNNNPAALVNATLNWNPGGVGGVYDPHPLGVWYDSQAKKWAIFNEGSMDPIPNGASFNLLLDTPVIHGAFVHTATSANTAGNHTFIDNASTNNNPKAIVFATPNFNPQGQGGTYENHNLGVFYRNGKWAIFNEDNAAMSVGVSFDVLASNPVS
ncbi:MAG: hypothetical protein NVS3B14_10910 [Ktedonobacteraceae bacterium]